MALTSTLSVSESASHDFYQAALHLLRGAGVPFLVGGAFAFLRQTGIHRVTKDLDLFVRKADVPRVFAACEAAGFRTELTAPHWLGKVWHDGDAFIDVIFNSGNGVALVDDDWFEHAHHVELWGVDLLLCPAEEMLWSKAFVMERERFDGSDVAHLLLALADVLDWPRLLRRFGEHWRVLLAHLVLFGFIFPSERARIPTWVMDELLGRLAGEREAPRSPLRVCHGTLLSWSQYLVDLERHRMIDGRLEPYGRLAPEEVAQWTALDKA